MQQATRREAPERISWARALIYAVGFFFISAILIGQLPGYIYLQLTASTLQGFEQGSLALAVTCLGIFTIIQVIVMLFDPKPIVPPIIFTGLGGISSLIGLVVIVWVNVTGFQYFPSTDAKDTTSILPLLGGKFLWFQGGAIDLLMLGIGILGVGIAMIFYSRLAVGEQSNPDRRDPGTTPAIRGMIIAGSIMVVVFLVFYTLVSDQGLAKLWFPNDQAFGIRIVNLIAGSFLGIAILLTALAFLLRLHYLMRPVRKKTMAPLYAVGALGLAQVGAIFLLLWVVAYPLVAWIHTWTFIGLNDYLTVCGNKLAIPASCTFSAQAGYLVDAIITTSFLVVLLAAPWIWKTNRNIVAVASFVILGAIAAATFMLHTGPDKLLVGMVLTIGMLVLAAIWTSVARREFAVVGENNLGCLGQWLVLGTCLFIYLGAFAFFSLPVWPPETEPNINFVAGQLLGPPPPSATEAAPIAVADAMVMLLIMALIAGVQFYFLTRNRYKV